MRFTPSGVDDALDQARRYIQVRYIIFLVSLLSVFLLTAIAGTVFVVLLLGGSDWERTAISGGVAAFLVVILIILQYRPARSFASAATQVAQLESTRASLNKSIEFWDRFLAERQEERQLSAENIALAVSSITAASRELVQSEVDTEMGPGARTARPGRTEEAQAPATKSAPDPRRY